MNTLTRLLLVAALMSAAGHVHAQREGRRAGDLRIPSKLKVGDPAPDFKLKTKEGNREVALSGFKGKRPVLLVFGSYT